jgi:hypothetical protein
LKLTHRVDLLRRSRTRQRSNSIKSTQSAQTLPDADGQDNQNNQQLQEHEQEIQEQEQNQDENMILDDDNGLNSDSDLPLYEPRTPPAPPPPPPPPSPPREAIEPAIYAQRRPRRPTTEAGWRQMMGDEFLEGVKKYAKIVGLATRHQELVFKLEHDGVVKVMEWTFINLFAAEAFEIFWEESHVESKLDAGCQWIAVAPPGEDMDFNKLYDLDLISPQDMGSNIRLSIESDDDAKGFAVIQIPPNQTSAPPSSPPVPQAYDGQFGDIRLSKVEESPVPTASSRDSKTSGPVTFDRLKSMRPARVGDALSARIRESFVDPDPTRRPRAASL